MHHKSIIYNKPTRYNSGSIVFNKNYRYALHVSDALCVHLQTQRASETCRAYLQLLINTILPELYLVGLLYIIAKSTITFFVACLDPIVRQGVVVPCRILFHYRSCMVSAYVVSLFVLTGKPSVGCFCKPCTLWNSFGPFPCHYPQFFVWRMLAIYASGDTHSEKLVSGS